jgi:hypothetical protein
MIRRAVFVIWIALIFASALSLQVLANWILSAGFALYVVWRWRSRRRRKALAFRPNESATAPSGLGRARWH